MSQPQPKPECITLSGNIKRVGIFAMPMVANTLMGIFPSLCSMWFLSRLGKDQLAAAGLASISFYTIVTLFVTGFYAVGIKVGHSMGEGKQDDVTYWVRTGLLLALVLSIPAMLIFLMLPHCLLLMGQAPHLVDIATPYFQFGALAIIMMLLNTAIEQYFSGIGHPRIAFMMSVITLPLIVGLSYFLVLGKQGFHQYGLGGINLASFIVDSLVCGFGILMMLLAKWSRPYRILSSFEGITFARCKSLFLLGWPISLQISGELLASSVLIYLLGLFGVSALAASQVVSQFTLIFVMITIGLSQAVSILVSQSMGAKKFIQARKTSQAGLLITLIVSSAFAVIFLLFPENLIDLYLDAKQPTHGMVVILGVKFLEIAAIYGLFDGVRKIMTSTLRGLHDAKIPMKIGLISLWGLGLPLAALLGFVYPHGPVAMRWGFTIGVILGAIWLWVRYEKQMRVRLRSQSF
jgi:MATE family multidrug resistance protein